MIKKTNYNDKLFKNALYIENYSTGNQSRNGIN